ncbi:hypothetical protein MMB17_15695 [Methylobacterium organophilum]|uniref:hypothetical protein n=1 Tax=Methylobacterium organophilum TaxID=410 RepID=UPI001F133C5E|nr:hypothetical protein [Methylobacterium organophilum]UMY16157.1 hypothetical protein MMB17_15695 [Methylobacterium organophilum]
MRQPEGQANESLGNAILRAGGLIAEANFGLRLIRAQRSVQRKYSPDQPRAPAGEPNGGQWIPGDGAGSSDTSASGEDAAAGDGETRQETVTEDGTRVLTIRVRPGAREWDEQHLIVAPDGESRIVETAGWTQTIRDGATGAILGRSTFTPRGAEPEAVVDPAFLFAAPLLVPATIEFIGVLAVVLAARKDRFRREDRFSRVVVGLTAHQIVPGADFKAPSALWTGRLEQADLDQACPRNGEIQFIANDSYARLKASGLYRTLTELGILTHADIARRIREKGDPNLKAEASFVEPNPARGIFPGQEARYGEKGSVRLDVLERTRPGTVCVYDFKTANAKIGSLRAIELATIVQKHYPETNRIIIIQMKPE